VIRPRPGGRSTVNQTNKETQQAVRKRVTEGSIRPRTAWTSCMGMLSPRMLCVTRRQACPGRQQLAEQ
jgi:hypothetical protein